MINAYDRTTLLGLSARDNLATDGDNVPVIASNVAAAQYPFDPGQILRARRLSMDVSRKNGFGALCRAVEDTYYLGGLAFENALTALSRALAFSVLKKCISGSGIKKNDGAAQGDKKHKASSGGCWCPALIKSRAEIARDGAAIDQLRRNYNNAIAPSSDDSDESYDSDESDNPSDDSDESYDSDESDNPDDDIVAHNIINRYFGDVANESIDSIDSIDSLESIESIENIVINNIINNNYGDGYDLVQVASVTVLDELRKQYVRGELPDLSGKYWDIRLSRRVYSYWDNPDPEWVCVATAPIQQAFQAVRRAVSDNGHVSYNPRSGYVYIADVVSSSSSNGEEGKEEEIYYRLPKYYDLGGYVRDFNGAFGVYTGDTESLHLCDDIDEYIDNLRLTEKQAKLLNLRLRGYGWKKSGEKMGTNRDNARACARGIGVKMVKKFVRSGGTEQQFDSILHGCDVSVPALVPEKPGNDFDDIHAKIAEMESSRAYSVIRAAKYDSRLSGCGGYRYYVEEGVHSFTFAGIDNGIISGYNDCFGDWDC